jgi:hypothetical protein
MVRLRENHRFLMDLKVHYEMDYKIQNQLQIKQNDNSPFSIID